MAEPAWEVSMTLRSRLGVWLERLDSNPFARARQSLDGAAASRRGPFRYGMGAHAEYDFAYLHRRFTYDRATLEAYESQLYLQNTFAALESGPFQLYVGRRVLAWGEGDMLSLLDRVSPRDLREPIQADLDELRLPVLMTAAAVQLGYHRFELIAVHEAHFGFRSPPLGSFSPISPPPMLLEQGFKTLRLEDREAGVHANGQQFFARWSYRGPGLDAALYAATALDALGIIDGAEATYSVDVDLQTTAPDEPLPAPAPRSVTMILRHPRYWLAGASSAVVAGSWLFKLEAFAAAEARVNVLQDGPLGLSSEKTASIGSMVGLTFSGISDAAFTIEASKVWLPAVDWELLFPLDAPSFAARYAHSLLRGDLGVELVTSVLGIDPEYGFVARGDVAYRLFDATRIGGGVVTYQPTSRRSFISRFQTHDQVLLKLRQDF